MVPSCSSWRGFICFLVELALVWRVFVPWLILMGREFAYVGWHGSSGYTTWLEPCEVVISHCSIGCVPLYHARIISVEPRCAVGHCMHGAVQCLSLVCDVDVCGVERFYPGGICIYRGAFGYDLVSFGYFRSDVF